MRGMVRVLLAGLMCLAAAVAYAQQAPPEPSSAGHPHKWQAVEKSLVDFLNEGFELKSVVYDASESGPPPALPDVHYFLQKKAQLARCDFRKRGAASIYWCALLVKPK